MDFYGKVKEVSEPVTGQGANGQWVRKTVVVESFDNPMNCIACDALNDRCEKLQGIQPGMAVKVTYGINSRKGDKGWFTTVNLWDIQKL